MFILKTLSKNICLTKRHQFVRQESPFLKFIFKHPYIWLETDPIYANASEYANITKSLNFLSSDDFRGNRS